MNLDSILNVIFFAVGLSIGLLQLYIAQHQFEVQQREKMDELRRILTEIQQRLAVIEGVTSDRVFDVQDKLIHLISGEQAVAEFTGETSKQIRALVEAELKSSGMHDSIQRTKNLEQKLIQILERSATSLVDQTSASDSSEPTARERQVLELLAQGKTNNEIAKTLSLSVMTVRVYIANLLRKLGLQNRSALVQAHLASQQHFDAPPSKPLS
jgi:DNA-binding CsgD family transcriptional regulator